jgi:Ca2+-binding EF-hand superfamily protein
LKAWNLTPSRVFRTIFEEHSRIIAINGVFPHRDHYYGRKTSVVGKRLLENSSVRFDLPLIANGNNIRFGQDPRTLWTTMENIFDAIDRIEALIDDDCEFQTTASTTSRSETEAARLHEVFRAFDKDGNGVLDVSELDDILTSTGRGYLEKDLRKAMARISGSPDVDFITFEQFSGLFRAGSPSLPEEAARRRFDQLDTDGSGEISLAELKSSLQQMDHLLTGAEVEEMMRLGDFDGNGSVSFEEYLALLSILDAAGSETSSIMSKRRTFTSTCMVLGLLRKLASRWDQQSMSRNRLSYALRSDFRSGM